MTPHALRITPHASRISAIPRVSAFQEGSIFEWKTLRSNCLPLFVVIHTLVEIFMFTFHNAHDK